MSNPIAGGRLFAIPFDLNRGPIERHTAMLDWMAQHTPWFASALSPEEARQNAAWMLTDPNNHKWEVWSGGTFAGMILVSRIVPRVDALFHFTLLPAKDTGVTLIGARKLLWSFLGHAFEAFDLQRITVEIPENKPKLAHFFRQRLAFKYEGELDLDRLRTPQGKGTVNLEVAGAASWIAAQGSRRERAHWDGTKFVDLMLLRLLRAEYDARASLGDTPQATREPLTTVHDELRRKTGPVSADDSPGHTGRPGQPVESLRGAVEARGLSGA